MTIIDVIIETADTNLSEVESYLRRRDVRLVKVIEGPDAVWLAMRDGSDDFEVSDVFPADQSDGVSRWHREQAYRAVHGTPVTIKEAQTSVIELDAARAARSKKGKKS